MPALQEATEEARTARIRLRRLSLEDVADVHRLRERPDVMKYTPTGPATDVSQTEDWIRDCLGRSNCYNFSIELLPARRVIGVLGAARAPEIGYILHPDYWGRGIATEALTAFLPLFWKKYEGIYGYATAKIDPDHFASRKVLEKCGFILWETKEQDFQSPTLGLRDTQVYRAPRPGTELSERAA
ncbi:GNAT domain-containing protein [Macrophomina phaseolina]|uniref:GNAT domain-containing protein n=1 Tax=Macrophomina phaseolina TaxID=35725 RepID=A0ABQ8GV70_9PEZI|nr:GNAT domain-containing protein [Macrophomina phaseolina]